MTVESETAAFADGEGVGECAGQLAERADVLAFLDRKRANAERVARQTPEFAEDCRATIRQLDIVRDYIANGLHEGAAFTEALLRPGGGTATAAAYPFTGHRTIEQLDAQGAAA